jgi:hypothetical protein
MVYDEIPEREQRWKSDSFAVRSGCAMKPEPEAWQIEAVDATPNMTGSPGLFGNAT